MNNVIGEGGNLKKLMFLNNKDVRIYLSFDDDCGIFAVRYKGKN